MVATSAIVSLCLISFVVGDGDVVGKLTVGYKAWYIAKEDGSPVNRWTHWTDTDVPRSNNINFEMYPDVREYKYLYETGFAKLGNGQPAKLFSSWDFDTISLHFKWMQDYNIDVAAIQRNYNATRPQDGGRNLYNEIAQSVMIAAQNTSKKFYISWDTSGWTNFYDEIFQDIENNLKPLALFNSSAYAQQNGKPVIGFWGLGFTDHAAEPAPTLALIQKLKSLGFYVIAGVPTYWRQEINDAKKNFRKVYLALDMLQPWSVGRFSAVLGAKAYSALLKDDYTLLKLSNVEIQPVVFPGFAWSNFQRGKAPKNQIPRLHGDFMWQQFVNLRTLGIKSAFVATFDDFDQGTAIAKAAENKTMIPTDQYFLTLDADGVRVSSDFYLRLVADGNRMVQGQIPLQEVHPTKNVP